MHKLQLIAEPSQQSIQYERAFDAPRELVFQAYTDPDLIPEWWGPRRYSTIVDQLVVKPGGIWRYINRDTAGHEYAFHGFFHQIAPPECLVCTFEFEGTPGHISLQTANFEEAANKKTILSGSTVFQSVEDRDQMLKTGMEEGFAESLDRLEELLTRLADLEKKETTLPKS